MTATYIDRRAHLSFSEYKRSAVRDPWMRVEPVTHIASGVRRSPSSHSQLKGRISRRQLTRRVLIGVIASLIVVAVLLPARTAFGGRSLVPSGRQSAEVSRAAHDSVKTVIVQKGDTLWSIAKKLEPKKDPREVVDQLVDARGTSSIHIGEKITWSK